MIFISLQVSRKLNFFSMYTWKSVLFGSIDYKREMKCHKYQIQILLYIYFRNCLCHNERPFNGIFNYQQYFTYILFIVLFEHLTTYTFIICIDAFLMQDTCINHSIIYNDYLCIAILQFLINIYFKTQLFFLLITSVFFEIIIDQRKWVYNIKKYFV